MQVLVDLVVVAGLGAAWVRLKRPPAEDPRLSRGLQLLQSKIAVIEDLSDRTDTQVRQLNALLETKCIEIQNKIIEAENIIRNIEASRLKSLETAKIFEDKIPHQEIVERQNTIKYVKAARLAHQGVPVAEILKQVDLSQAEVEFIAKVNREQLMFSEAELPDWVQDKVDQPSIVTNKDDETLRNLGEQFKKAVQNAQATKSLSQSQAEYQMPQQSFMEIKLDDNLNVEIPAAPKSATPAQPQVQTATTTKGQTVEVKPFAFRKIEVPK
jgi:hypothetical protein